MTQSNLETIVIIGIFISTITMFYAMTLSIKHFVTFRKLPRWFNKMRKNGDGKEFEDFLKKLFEACGWHVKNPTSSVNSPDFGVDMILDGKIAVQAKHYKDNVGNDAIMAVFAGMNYWKKNGFPHLRRAAVVTSSHFTASAKKQAKDIGVLLKDEDDIREILKSGPRKNWITKQRSGAW